MPAVTRAVAILRLLARESEPVGVKAIADSLGLVTSTCLHILRVLVQEGLVKVDPSSKRYSLGLGLLPLARSVLQQSRFPQLVQPALDRLAGLWEVTAMGVEVLGLDHMIVLSISSTPGAFRLQVAIGSRFPALISATGRLVAAHTHEPWAEVSARFRRLQWQDPPTLAQWRGEVARAREQGYSVDAGRYIHGVTVVSVPVGGPAPIRHCLVATGLSDHLKGERLEALIQQMKQEAQALDRLVPTP